MLIINQSTADHYQPSPLPTYEDITHFMEHGKSDELDIRLHIGLKPIPSDSHDEDRFLKPTSSPPPYRDLVDILHQ